MLGAGRDAPQGDRLLGAEGTPQLLFGGNGRVKAAAAPDAHLASNSRGF